MLHPQTRDGFTGLQDLFCDGHLGALNAAIPPKALERRIVLRMAVRA